MPDNLFALHPLGVARAMCRTTGQWRRACIRASSSTASRSTTGCACPIAWRRPVRLNLPGFLSGGQGMSDTLLVPIRKGLFRLVVTRTRDAGKTFQSLTDDVPPSHAYDAVYRHAPAIVMRKKRRSSGVRFRPPAACGSARTPGRPLVGDFAHPCRRITRCGFRITGQRGRRPRATGYRWRGVTHATLGCAPAWHRP